jgi:hypothetical protein
MYLEKPSCFLAFFLKVIQGATASLKNNAALINYRELVGKWRCPIKYKILQAKKLTVLLRKSK